MALIALLTPPRENRDPNVIFPKFLHFNNAKSIPKKTSSPPPPLGSPGLHSRMGDDLLKAEAELAAVLSGFKI